MSGRKRTYEDHLATLLSSRGGEVREAGHWHGRILQGFEFEGRIDGEIARVLIDEVGEVCPGPTDERIFAATRANTSGSCAARVASTLRSRSTPALALAAMKVL